MDKAAEVGGQPARKVAGDIEVGGDPGGTQSDKRFDVGVVKHSVDHILYERGEEVVGCDLGISVPAEREEGDRLCGGRGRGWMHRWGWSR